MANIISRFAKIMEANINDLIDKCEDPAKMIDQTMRDLQKNLEEVDEQTANVKANQLRCQRIADEKKKEIDKMQKAAEGAVDAGNDDDAAKFLAEKARLTADLANDEANLQVATDNYDKMLQMERKLKSDIKVLESRKDTIKATIANAKAQESINKATSAIDSDKGVAAFKKYEDKANKMLDKAQAKAELQKDTDDDLSKKADEYIKGTSNPDIDAELAALKAARGKA